CAHGRGTPCARSLRSVDEVCAIVQRLRCTGFLTSLSCPVLTRGVCVCAVCALYTCTHLALGPARAGPGPRWARPALGPARAGPAPVRPHAQRLHCVALARATSSS